MTPLLAKRAIKRTAGLASVLLGAVTPAPRRPSACVLVYHRVSSARVSERRLDDWSITPRSLERHIASLVEDTELVFVRELHDRLTRPATTSKPLACLTFDDGYQNFHDEVLPILQRYGAKATVFVVSGYVGSTAPMPFDRWGVRHASHTPAAAWRPLNWPSLERCARAGLVEIGGHSHRHANAAYAPPGEIAEEAERCRHLLTKRLGPGHVVSYAYPYGSSRLGQVTGSYVAAVQHAGYHSAVTTNVGLADAQSDRFRLPRVEVYRSDTPAVVHAKVGGALMPFLITDRLRRAKR